ncbi:MAG TPA: hypothetical protein VMK12_25825 [Anaeromyxobacteraceae bacterium]|nr:hypothetical protein [Anaeromyxobacteraceae bacterium]
MHTTSLRLRSSEIERLREEARAKAVKEGHQKPDLSRIVREALHEYWERRDRAERRGS